MASVLNFLLDTVLVLASFGIFLVFGALHVQGLASIDIPGKHAPQNAKTEVFRPRRGIKPHNVDAWGRLQEAIRTNTVRHFDVMLPSHTMCAMSDMTSTADNLLVRYCLAMAIMTFVNKARAQRQAHQSLTASEPEAKRAVTALVLYRPQRFVGLNQSPFSTIPLALDDANTESSGAMITNFGVSAATDSTSTSDAKETSTSPRSSLFSDLEIVESSDSSSRTSSGSDGLQTHNAAANLPSRTKMMDSGLDLILEAYRQLSHDLQDSKMMDSGLDLVVNAFNEVSNDRQEMMNELAEANLRISQYKQSLAQSARQEFQLRREARMYAKLCVNDYSNLAAAYWQTMQRDMQALEDEVFVRDNDIAKLVEGGRALVDRLSRAQENNSYLQQYNEDLQAVIGNLEVQNRQLEIDNRALFQTSGLQQFAQEIQRRGAVIEKQDDHIERLQAEVAKLRRENDDKDQQMQTLHLEIAQLSDNKHDLQSQLRHAEKAGVDDRRNLQAENRRLEAEVSNLKKSALSSSVDQAEMAELRSEVKELKAKGASLKQQNASAPRPQPDESSPSRKEAAQKKAEVKTKPKAELKPDLRPEGTRRRRRSVHSIFMEENWFGQYRSPVAELEDEDDAEEEQEQESEDDGESLASSSPRILKHGIDHGQLDPDLCETFEDLWIERRYVDLLSFEIKFSAAIGMWFTGLPTSEPVPPKLRGKRRRLAKGLGKWLRK